MVSGRAWMPDPGPRGPASSQGPPALATRARTPRKKGAGARIIGLSAGVYCSPVALRRSVLIVEDDADAAELTARRLAASGLDVHISLGPEGSLAAFEAEQCKLVILDVDMPGLEGTHLIQGLWERPEAQRPCVLLYSNLDPELLEAKARKHGADAWLSKSASKEELVACVDELLGDEAANEG